MLVREAVKRCQRGWVTDHARDLPALLRVSRLPFGARGRAHWLLPVRQ